MVLKVLPRGVSPADRPSIVLRIFRQQVLYLTKQLINGKVPGWGPLKVIISVIEFQKRELPHIHILYILNRIDRILAEEINKYYVAEIPNKNESPEDWKIFISFMLHIPCGSVNPGPPCFQKKKGKCDHNFSQQYCAVSSFSEPDGSQIYRRRTPSEVGASGLVRLRLNKRWVGYEYASKYIVPHNLWLLKSFGCHINSEICSSIKVIKYLLWYPFKGDTRVIGSTQKTNDEVGHYADLRTVGVMEAFWKIYEFPLHLRYPFVTILPINLEDDQQVYFDEDANLKNIQKNPSLTQLKYFFLYNE